MRKRPRSLALAVAIAASGSLLAPTNLRAQTGAPRSALGNDIPAEAPPQPTNQQLDYRTNQQILQRRVNNANITCAENTADCSQVAPQVESLQDNETLNQIRNSRQQTQETAPGQSQ